MSKQNEALFRNAKKITVTLECSHELYFRSYPPKKMERVWCPRCGDMRAVEVTAAEFRIKCRGCRLSRPFGRDEESAKLLGARHHNKRGHTVQLFDGLAMVHEWQGTEPSDDVRASVLARLDLDL